MKLKDLFYGTTNQLLNDKRFHIDEEFFNRRLKFCSLKKYKIIKIKLGDISYENTPLKNVKPYQYLDGNKQGYEQYCKYHQSVLHINMSLERYNKLINSIETSGYNSRYIIIVNDKKQVMDGQHRACVLLHKYGEDHEVSVLCLKLKKRSFIRKIQRKIFMLIKNREQLSKV